MLYSKNDFMSRVRDNIERQKLLQENKAKAMSSIVRVEKADGGDFADIRKNFKSISQDVSIYFQDDGGKRYTLELRTYNERLNYQTYCVQCYSHVKPEDYGFYEVQGRLIKDTLYTPYIEYTPEEIELNIAKAANHARAIVKRLEGRGHIEKTAQAIYDRFADIHNIINDFRNGDDTDYCEWYAIDEALEFYRIRENMR